MTTERTIAEPSGDAVVRGPELFSGLRVALLLKRRKTWQIRLLLVCSDVVALLLAFFVAERIVESDAFLSGDVSTRALIFLLTLPGWIAGVSLLRLYERDDQLIDCSTLDELPKVVQFVTLGASAFLVLTWATGAGATQIGTLVLFCALGVCILPLMRAAARAEFQRYPHFPQNTVIVGAGSVGQLLGRKFLQHPEYHINLLGFVDDQPKERRDDLADLTILGGIDDLQELVDELAIERVVIAFSNAPSEQTMELVRALNDYPVVIDIVPRFFDVIPPRLSTQTIEGIPVLTLPRLRLTAWHRFLKRTLDIVVGGAAILLFAPVFALVALLIKVDSDGPVFFRQQRMGAHDEPFGMFKFRTMVTDAEERKAEVAHLNKHLRPGGDPRMFKISRDPRITRVGYLLRRYSLDELPQLINVVSGEMSLIGPRPLILPEDQFIESWGRKRLLLKPGMTGLWQVLGRTAIPFEEMVKLDYLYITTWSVGNDIKLLLRTVPVVFRGAHDGAH